MVVIIPAFKVRRRKRTAMQQLNRIIGYSPFGTTWGNTTMSSTTLPSLGGNAVSFGIQSKYLTFSFGAMPIATCHLIPL